MVDQSGVNGSIIEIDPFVGEDHDQSQADALYEGSEEQVSQIEDSNDHNLSPANKVQTNSKKTTPEGSFLVRRKKGVRVLLKNRKDVILKSIIRSVKKLFTLAFNSNMPKSRFASKYKKLRCFENSVRKFVNDLSLPRIANSESSIAEYDEEML